MQMFTTFPYIMHVFNRYQHLPEPNIHPFCAFTDNHQSQSIKMKTERIKWHKCCCIPIASVRSELFTASPFSDILVPYIGEKSVAHSATPGSRK